MSFPLLILTISTVILALIDAKLAQSLHNAHKQLVAYANEQAFII